MRYNFDKSPSISGVSDSVKADWGITEVEAVAERASVLNVNAPCGPTCQEIEPLKTKPLNDVKTQYPFT